MCYYSLLRRLEKNQKRINVENNTCLDNCDLLPNTFEYEANCYKNCPNESYRHLYFDSYNNHFIDCLNSSEGYYLDENDSL